MPILPNGARPTPYPVEGEAAEVAAAEAARLDAAYDTERLKTLINAEGWAQA